MNAWRRIRPVLSSGGIILPKKNNGLVYTRYSQKQGNVWYFYPPILFRRLEPYFIVTHTNTKTLEISNEAIISVAGSA
ncbi:hypothetical protein A3I34_00190 [Candidatus Jorgensenbacteria bacterium RIFCSPLOWO2_02_FULL_45_12]|uniref:Uncharacterized protein n=1 Tax=Candidatus Jorgensenbacteria bacterium RIFCSPHIGHO2_02_FULL_45_20 TaxID=1798470 RepID=A0A1F6BQ24_9BACT|nr:MAG: hypothetical protein A3D55_01320 [Candidatus Jorgensenbacteria bacterium RIFCSPHIGHO2_02_FULL_45_20]OGG42266.1 MAG: hypothetical protein A3I34_00190 [Candidatus Jorgensenbacteria bacterium RIFCSPLOWO2_02_FULL_45_12]